MDKKELLKAGLQKVRQKAAGNFNHITVGEILQCFPDMDLTREQVALIYKYAEEEHIVIEDYQPHDTRSVSVGEKKMTGEELAYFQMYLEDLEAVEPCTKDEVEMLMERLMNGEDYIISRLTEGHLHMVLEMARKRAGNGVLIGDLVQEGNVALMEALSDLAGGMQILSGGLGDYLSEKVDRALKQLIDEHGGYKKAGERMARETNRLLEVTVELEEELGREATLAELAEKIQLPEDKVKELIQVSMNAAEFAASEGEETGEEPV